MTGASIPVLVRLHMNYMTLEAILNVNYASMEAVQTWDMIIMSIFCWVMDA